MEVVVIRGPHVDDWVLVNQQENILLGKITSVYRHKSGTRNVYAIYSVEWQSYILAGVDNIEMVYSPEQGLTYDIQYAGHF